MQRSRPGDFRYRSNCRNSLHEVSVPPTKIYTNLKAPYQENKVDDLEYSSQSPSILPDERLSVFINFVNIYFSTSYNCQIFLILQVSIFKYVISHHKVIIIL